MRSQGILLCAVAVVAGCSEDPAPTPPRAEPPSPTEGVDDAALAGLLVEHWDLEVALDPMDATFLGDHRMDTMLPPIRRAEVEALRVRRRGLLDRVVALDAAAMTARDRLTHAILVERLGAEADLDVCDYERWAISPRRSLIGQLDNLGNFHLLQSSEDAASYRARVEAMPAAVDAFAAELAAGAADGEVGGRQSVQGLVDRVRGWADRAPADWPMVFAIRNGALEADVRDRLISDVSGVIARQLAPAYRRFVMTLETAVLPEARDVEGLAGLAAGTDCYAAEIRRHTTLPMTAAELHELGLAETARVEAAIVALGREVYGVGTLAEIRARLDADASLHFTSEAAVLTWVRGTIDRARTRVEPLFATFPAAPLEVTPYAAELGPIAASYRASPDGVLPARFYLVTQPPNFVSRWDLESTTYHEAIPGHHLQVGRTVEMAALPALRRAIFDTAFVEGWGLYAETLAGELDLFTDGAARIGRLANEALRTCRLVIDTGLHDLGWTRAEAIAFMEQHSLFGGAFVAGEIERYLAMPGQALAYKVGELELLRLRGELQARQGAGFSLRAFHEAVLGEGSLPLPILAERLVGTPVTLR